MATIQEHYAYVVPPPPISYVEVDLEDNYSLPLHEAKRLIEGHIHNGVAVRITNENYSMMVPRGIYTLSNQGDMLQAIILLRAFAAKVYLDSKHRRE